MTDSARVKITFNRMNESAKLPQNKYTHDMGYDIYVQRYELHPENKNIIQGFTGIAIQASKKRYGYFLVPRSSTFLKWNIEIINRYQIIHENTNEEIVVWIKNKSNIKIPPSNIAIAQLIIYEVPQKEITNQRIKNDQNEIIFEKIREDATLPKITDMGYSLCVVDFKEHELNENVIQGFTGIKIKNNPNLLGFFLVPTTIATLKWNVEIVNHPGIIDPGYRGEIILLIRKTDEFIIPPNNYEICLLIPYKKPQLEILDDMKRTQINRGTHGFGSSDFIKKL